MWIRHQIAQPLCSDAREEVEFVHFFLEEIAASPPPSFAPKEFDARQPKKQRY